MFTPNGVFLVGAFPAAWEFGMTGHIHYMSTLLHLKQQLLIPQTDIQDLMSQCILMQSTEWTYNKLFCKHFIVEPT